MNTFFNSRLSIVLVLIATLFAGCVQASVTRLNDTTRPPLQPSQVTIYLDEDDIEGDYEKMGLIDLSAMSGIKEEKIYKKAREEAAEIGANGVMLQNMEEAGTGEKVASALLGTGSDTDAKMIAIYVEGKR